MNASSCLFGDVSTGCAGSKAEHIIQEGLCGSLTSRVVICGSCNEYFGNSIDRDISQLYQPILMLPEDALVGRLDQLVLHGRTSSGIPIRVMSGGVSSPKKIIDVGEEGAWVVPNSVPKEIARQRFSTAYGTAVDKLNTAPIVPGDVAGGDDWLVSLDISEGTLRALIVDCLEFMAHCEIVARLPRHSKTIVFQRLRSLARNGDGRVMQVMRNRIHFALLDRWLQQEMPPSGDMSLMHRIAVDYSVARASWCFVIQIADTLPWFFEYSDTTMTSDFCAVYSKELVRRSRASSDFLEVRLRSCLSDSILTFSKFPEKNVNALVNAQKIFNDRYRLALGQGRYLLDMLSDAKIAQTLDDMSSRWTVTVAISNLIAFRYQRHPAVGQICALASQLVSTQDVSDILKSYRDTLERVKTQYGFPQMDDSLENF